MAIPQPPISGQWKPGQSGNPKGRPKSKPFKDAIQRLLEHNPQAADEMAAAMIAKASNGDVAAFKELADRLDGKVPTTLGQSDEHGPLEISWKQSRSITSQDPNSSDSTTEQNASPASSPTDEPAKP